MILEVWIGAPMPIPSRVHENCLAAKIQLVEAIGSYGGDVVVDPDDYALDRRQVLQRQLGNVDAVCITVKRTVDVRPRIGDHLDLSNLEFGSRLVPRSRIDATEPIADNRRREVLVSDHSVFDDVAQIDMS